MYVKILSMVAASALIAACETPAGRGSAPEPELITFEDGLIGLKSAPARFDPAHPSVEITAPADRAAPAVVYAHGGGGFGRTDAAAVAWLKSSGFATVKFDSFRMNGFADMTYVNTTMMDYFKQLMIRTVAEGAVEFATVDERLKGRKIFLVGSSNGGSAAIQLGARHPAVCAVVAMWPSGNMEKPDSVDRPIRLYYGTLDNWGAPDGTTRQWQMPVSRVMARLAPSARETLESWAKRQKDALGRDVEMILYPGGAHDFFGGPVRTTVREMMGAGQRWPRASQGGAPEEVLAQFKVDARRFIDQEAAKCR